MTYAWLDPAERPGQLRFIFHQGGQVGADGVCLSRLGMHEVDAGMPGQIRMGGTVRPGTMVRCGGSSPGSGLAAPAWAGLPLGSATAGGLCLQSRGVARTPASRRRRSRTSRPAIAEATYALDTLRADGVAVETNHHGMYMGDPRLDPLFAELNRRRAVVFMHPTSPTCPCCQTLSLRPRWLPLAAPGARTAADRRSRPHLPRQRLAVHAAAHRDPARG